jgi:hypothetical protein
MTEDEAKTVAGLAAQCVRGGRSRWGLVMRYGRLFTPGTDVGGGHPMIPAWVGKNAYRRAMDSGLRYAEGYACLRSGIVHDWAWCLDGETVVDPGSSEPGTAYFGVALRSGYVRRVHEAQRYDDGSDGFRSVFLPGREATNPPPDPASDIAGDLGRDIPSWVRDWALNAAPRSGRDRAAPAWVLDELLSFPDVRAPQPSVSPPAAPVEERAPDTDAALKAHDTASSAGPLPMSYARYLVRRAEWLESGMALSCSGRTGGVSSDNGAILNTIRDGDSLDTLIRMADEHRARCEWAVCRADEREHPELTVQRRAEVHLRWTRGFQANHSFAVLHRLDHNVWDAWLHPTHLDGSVVRKEPPVRLTRNGVSYEMALMAAFRAMGDELPENFSVVYRVPEPDRPPI